MRTPHRTIRLRRPAILSVQEGVFVPQGDSSLLDEIEQRWQRLCKSNPAYFDGRLYRFFAVQNDQFDLGVRGLGVKAITTNCHGAVLIGRRARHVGSYPGLSEFAPAGSVEPAHEPAEVIQKELIEETGLTSLHEPIPIALLFDPILPTWELMFHIEAAEDRPAPRTLEYELLQWRRPNDLPSDLSPVALQIAPLLDQVR